MLTTISRAEVTKAHRKCRCSDEFLLVRVIAWCCSLFCLISVGHLRHFSRSLLHTFDTSKDNFDSNTHYVYFAKLFWCSRAGPHGAFGMHSVAFISDLYELSLTLGEEESDRHSSVVIFFDFWFTKVKYLIFLNLSNCFSYVFKDALFYFLIVKFLTQWVSPSVQLITSSLAYKKTLQNWEMSLLVQSEFIY